MPISQMREVVIVYLVNLLIFPILFAVVELGFLQALQSNLFIYGPLLEFFLLGFAALLFALADHDEAEIYGITRKGLARSMVLGLGFVALRGGFRYALGVAPFELGLKEFTQAFGQSFPYNIGLAVFSAFSYGPLEMFYITFLVVKLDRAFSPTSRGIMSKGSFVGVALWALIHLNNAFFFGLAGATIQVVTNLIVGLVLVAIFKHSGNSLGPMVCFTTFNLAQ